MFLSHGYQSAPFKDVKALQAFEHFKYPKAYALDYVVDPQAQVLLDSLQEYIGREYISNIYGSNYTIVSNTMWEGIDAGSLEWHNDAVEGTSSSFLIYMDSSVLGVRGVEELYVHAGTYEYIWVNQGPAFEHKAVPSGISRRILGFEFAH
jgi:hypothetical protein